MVNYEEDPHKQMVTEFPPIVFCIWNKVFIMVLAQQLTSTGEKRKKEGKTISGEESLRDVVSKTLKH